MGPARAIRPAGESGHRLPLACPRCGPCGHANAHRRLCRIPAATDDGQSKDEAAAQQRPRRAANGAPRVTKRMTGANPCAGRYARRMRYPGENTSGRAPGRRQNPFGRNTPPQARPAAGGAGGTGAGRVAAGGKAASDASVFAPGYTGGRAPRGDQAPAGGGWSGSSGGATSQGPARGFPPAPGQPPPLYPPGQFAAWNRGPAPGENGYDPGLTGPLSGTWQAGYPDAAVSSQARHADAGYSDAGYADTGYSDQGYATAGYADSGYADGGSGDPGYSALAVTDRAADATNTQAWSVPEDAANTQVWSVSRRGREHTGLECPRRGREHTGLGTYRRYGGEQRLERPEHHGRPRPRCPISPPPGPAITQPPAPSGQPPAPSAQPPARSTWPRPRRSTPAQPSAWQRDGART